MQDKPVFSSSTISPDGKINSLIFENLIIGLEKNTGKGMFAASKVVSFTVPVLNADTELKIKQDIRGFVFLGQGAQAVLIAQTGGNTTVFNWTQSSGVNEEFYKTYEVVIPKGNTYLSTFILLVERDKDDIEAQLHVDTVDISIADFKSE